MSLVNLDSLVTRQQPQAVSNKPAMTTMMNPMATNQQQANPFGVAMTTSNQPAMNQMMFPQQQNNMMTSQQQMFPMMAQQQQMGGFMTSQQMMGGNQQPGNQNIWGNPQPSNGSTNPFINFYLANLLQIPA